MDIHHRLIITSVMILVVCLAGCTGHTLNLPAGDGYTTEEIAYFTEIAFGAEYNDVSRVIRKWHHPLRIQVHGTPGAQDLAVLDRVIGELNEILTGSITLKRVDRQANVDIHFAPESSFSDITDNYVPVNYGFFWVWWNTHNVIERALIMIATEGITQRERSHLIREEVTQILGLMQDSWLYPDSIFYQGWTDTQEYSPLDRRIIEMLYLPEIRPGMSPEEVLEVLPLQPLEPVPDQVTLLHILSSVFGSTQSTAP